jgi:hypothetical protein
MFMGIVRYGVVAVVVLSCGGRGPVAGASDGRPVTQAKHSDSAVQAERAEVVRIEREYRHRLARLNRLRELAEQQDDSDRLAQLDELYDRLREDRLKIREQTRTGREYRETRRSRHEIRGSARDRAEQRWLDARHETGVKIHAPTHMNHAASRLAEKRWREEARDHGAERLERAAQRSGMLDDVPQSEVGRGQQGRAGRGGRVEISEGNADREFERLRREIGWRGE